MSLKRFGLTISGASLVVALLMGAYFIVRKEDIPLALLALPAVGFLTGILIAFFDWSAGFFEIQDEIEELPKLLEDDIEALRQGQITTTHLMTLFTVVTIMAELALLLTYQKWQANWGPFGVMFVGLVIALITAVLCIKADWFQERWDRLPVWIFIIPTVGFLLCAGLGVYYAEPSETGGISQQQRDSWSREEQDTYYWSQTRASRIVFFDQSTTTYSGSSPAIHIPECSGKNCGYFYFAILLVIVVIICILGSVFIPHFWVVATLLLLTLMAVIALRELLYTDRSSRSSYSWR